MAGEPTLRYGDDRADGWIEFLQDLLVRRGWPCGRDGTDGIDGNFGIHTLKAVKDFQGYHELQSQDGVVGSEAWSSLRGQDGPDAPAADGSTEDHPERGTQVRFNNYARFEAADGSLTIGGFSVGTKDPSSGSIQLSIHLEDPVGDEYGVEAEHWADGDEQWFVVDKAASGRPDGRYSGVARLPIDVGGEVWSFGFRKESVIDLSTNRNR